MGRGVFRELRRRYVFRVAAAYVLTAWLLMQLAAILFPAFGAPHWAIRLLFGFLILGFPVAALLAWAFEVTPEGVQHTVAAEPQRGQPAGRRRRVGRTLDFVIIAVLAAAVGVLLWQRFGTGGPAEATRIAGATASTSVHASTLTRPAPAPLVPAKSIAVLPFENLSPDKNNAYFAAGMQDMILTKLADIGDLKVISRTSTEGFSSHPADLQAIGRDLDVATILEGSVQKAGDRVLINVQLINAATDAHLWAQAYTRSLKNIFGVEGEVAQKIADALNAKLSAREKRRLATVPRASPAAKEAYIRGRAVMSSGPSDPNFEKAAAAYQEAVRLDPKFGVAWASLANDEAALYSDHVGDRQAELTAARRALDQALVLAPDAAETQLAVARLKIATRMDFRGASAALQRAAARAPGNSDVMLAMARVQEALGHWHDAVRYARKAVTLDPLDRGTLVRAARVYIDVRHFGRALELVDRMLAIQPDDRAATATKAFIYQDEGRFAAAGKLLAGAGATPPTAPDSQVFRVALRQRFLTHDYAGALRMLRPLLGRSSKLNSDWKVVYRPMLARAQRLSGRLDAALGTWKAQVTAVRKLMMEKSENDPYSQAVAHSLLGEAEAGLGHKAAAIAAGHTAIALDSEDTDVAGGRKMVELLAKIEAQVGEPTRAIALLRHLLTVPYIEPVTVPILRADPSWDPLRKDPRFQLLISQPITVSVDPPPEGTHPL